MPGNKKGGKNGGGSKKKKKKEQEVKDSLTEVDKEYYELQLNDLNRKLTRLQSRSAELESSNTELEENLTKLDEDRSDIIAYLKKALLLKTNEMVELQERLDGLKQSMDSGVIKYKEEIAQMKQEYKNVHEELTSEIKLLMGKLNSLEEFRTQKEELMAKFATQELEIEEQNQRHKRELYEHEKKFVLEKDKLKRQMETRLLQLSVQLQEATDVRIAATTHRMIRENIAINNEMTKIQETQKKMNETYESMKAKLGKARLEVEVLEDEKQNVLNKNLLLLKVVVEVCHSTWRDMRYLAGELRAEEMKAGIIDKLTNEHKKYEERLKEMSSMDRECARLRANLAEREEQLRVADEEIKTLTNRLSSGQTHTAKLYAEVAALKLNSRRLNATLQRAVIAVKEAVRLQEEPEPTDEAVVLEKRNALLGNLLQLLNRGEMAEKERIATHRTPVAYETGYLGFVPRAND